MEPSQPGPEVKAPHRWELSEQPRARSASWKEASPAAIPSGERTELQGQSGLMRNEDGPPLAYKSPKRMSEGPWLYPPPLLIQAPPATGAQDWPPAPTHSRPHL